jgi:hypothetical protein
MIAKFSTLIFLVSAAVSNSLFAGEYSDPNHPSCLRVIGLETSVSAQVYGADAADGEGESCDGVTDVKWGPLPAIINGLNITVDFSSKGGPNDIAGQFNEVIQQIEWADGNAWKKL